MLIGMIHDQQKNYEAAREAYEKVLALDPKFSPALNNLAYLYSEHLGQLDKAYETARTAKELLPTDPATADTFGWILYKRGQYSWALSLLQESAEKLSSEPEVQFHLGMAYYMMGEEEPARIALQRALQMNKEFRGKDEAAKSLTVLSYNVETVGTEARAGLEKRLAERPDDPVALARLAIIYERARDIAKASGAYQTVLKNNPRNVRALENAARLSATQPENAKQVLELAKGAYKLAPDDPRVAYVLGRLAYQTGDFQWAANLLQETARKQPASAQVQYDLAQALYSVGRVQDAESATRTALQLDSSFPQAGDAKRFLKMVALHANPSQALAAESEVGQVLISDPDYVPALMVAAAINEQKPNTASAKQLYEKVLSRYPDFVPALKRLAVLYSEDLTNNQKAYDLATQARKALPNDPELARTLGIIAYRQGDYARSTRLLQESASKGMDDAQLMYYLGMSQYQLKEPAKSKQALQRALKLELPDNLAAEARRILAELK
jgi:tetratricopeptide (TPR) repeat protein